ncbi:MAG: hypothetical protein RLZZ28_899 [Bacteroidota bacterium]
MKTYLMIFSVLILLLPIVVIVGNFFGKVIIPREDYMFLLNVYALVLFAYFLSKEKKENG